MGLFLFLPQNFIGSQPVFNNQIEVIYSSHDDQKAPLVFDSGIETNQTPFAFKTSKLQIVQLIRLANQSDHITCEHKLLYFGIGNAIELKLTSTTVIFPFHFFT